MGKEKIIEIIDELLQDCYNDLFEDGNAKDEREEKDAELIYKNVELFTLKFKDKLEEI